MTYSNEVIKLAYDELERRRNESAALRDMRVEEIRTGYPEIYRVYSAITSTKDRLAEVIFSKKGDARAEIEKIRDENLRCQSELKRLLRAFSLPEDYLDRKYHCPICCDSGVKDGNRCECVTALLDRFAVEKLNEQCKIKLGSFADFDISYYPESYEYRGQTVNAREKMSENLRFCMDYAKSFGPDSVSLFMYGRTGLGKTFLSGCIANELLQRGVSVAFDSIQNYLRQIENEHFGRSDGVTDTLQTLLNADLAILDDLGSEFGSQFNSSAIYNIINSRLNMGKPTIVSSNLLLEELTQKYDDRIISRLTGMFYTVRFIGEDIRQIKRRKGIFS